MPCLFLQGPEEFLLSSTLLFFFSFVASVLGTAKPWEQLQAGQLLAGSSELLGQAGQETLLLSDGLALVFYLFPNQAQTGMRRTFTVEPEWWWGVAVFAFSALLALSVVTFEDLNLDCAHLLL